MAIQFIIDSAADIIPAEAEKLGLVHLPLKIMFGDTEYSDSVDLSHHEFYEKLAASEDFPKTSQVNPDTFFQAFQKVVDNGDTAVVITLSSKLSGTYQSAMIAADDYEGKIFVVDSLNVAIGQRILLQRGLELRDNGLSAEEIAAQLDREKYDIRLYAQLDTLEYLKKGGRISPAVAMAGNLLSIKPIISVQEGEVAMAGKARGVKKGNSMLRELVTNAGGINYGKPFSLAYSGLNDEMLRKFLDDSADFFALPAEQLPQHSVGCTIGTHIGPGVVAVAFFVNR